MSDRNPAVDTYLENLAPARRADLGPVRELIREVAPGAVETMRYRMPTYEYKGGILCAFASQKHYMSLYVDMNLVEKYRAELAGLSVGKSCIRFRKLEDLPMDAVRAILEETLEIYRGH